MRGREGREKGMVLTIWQVVYLQYEWSVGGAQKKAAGSVCEGLYRPK